jgi:nucleoside-diphosphate-sugar epimerase
MQNVLVTGGTGFIGRILVAELRRRHCRVRVLARIERPDLCAADEWFCADLDTPATLAGAARGCDTVFHLAGYAHATSKPYPEEVERHRRINLAGTQAVLEDALSARVERFVYVSSVKAAGEDAGHCIDETTDIEPTDPYGRIKRECEQLVLSACAAQGVHAAVIRPALVYGAGVKGNIAAMAAWIRKGIFPPPPDTSNIRSMVEVRDLVVALLAAAERPQARGKAYIITDGEAYSTRRVYLALRQALGKPAPRASVPAWLLRLGGRFGDGLEWLLRRPLPLNSTITARLLDSACYRSVRARQDLDFHPRYRFEDVVMDLQAPDARG